MICALDELEKYRYDLYNGHRDEVISVRNGRRIERDENKTIEYVKNTKACLEVDDVLNSLDDILDDVKHLVSL